MEGVEVVLWVHGGLEPDLLRGSPKTPLQGVACLAGKGGSSAENMQRVILPVAQSGHIPGQLVQASLYILIVLYSYDTKDDNNSKQVLVHMMMLSVA